MTNSIDKPKYTRREWLSAAGIGGVSLGSGYLMFLMNPVRIVSEDTPRSTINITITNDTDTAQECTLVLKKDVIFQPLLELTTTIIDPQTEFKRSYNIPTNETFPLQILFEQDSKKLRRTQALQIQPETTYNTNYFISDEKWVTE